MRLLASACASARKQPHQCKRMTTRSKPNTPRTKPTITSGAVAGGEVCCGHAWGGHTWGRLCCRHTCCALCSTTNCCTFAHRQAQSIDRRREQTQAHHTQSIDRRREEKQTQPHHTQQRAERRQAQRADVQQDHTLQRADVQHRAISCMHCGRERRGVRRDALRDERPHALRDHIRIPPSSSDARAG